MSASTPALPAAVSLNGRGSKLTKPADSLIRVLEIWKPTAEGDKLALDSGLYVGLDDFRAASREVTFAKGDGLPGHVWQTMSPYVLADLSQVMFHRAQAAVRAGLTSGVGLPIIEAGQLRAVVVMLCDNTSQAKGAFEVWGREEADELKMTGHYYANLGGFSAVSQYVRYPLGAGLPGGVWEARFPRIMDALDPASGFARAAGTRGDDGFNIAIGLPFMRTALDLDAVVVILSARDTPLARGFELWKPDADGTSHLIQSAYGDLPGAAEARPALSFARGAGLVGMAFDRRAPITMNFTTSANSSTSVNNIDAESSRAHSGIAFPMFAGEKLEAIFVMLI